MNTTVSPLFQVQRDLITELAKQCQVVISCGQRNQQVQVLCPVCAPVVARMVDRSTVIRDLCQLALGTSGLRPCPVPEADLDLARAILAAQFEQAKLDRELDHSKLRALQMHLCQLVRAW